MKTSLVLTVVGDDRTGLISALSDTIAAFGGNWTETRMASLGGKFAGILLVTVPQAQANDLIAAVKRLDARTLHVDVERSEADTPSGTRLLTLELIGQDRPGIVRDISHLLAEHGINIEELETACVSGSFSGEALFKAQARLRLPRELSTADLRASLEALANELMVDLSLDEAAPHNG
ncbi:MAG: ACT domain-containing protein [Betaproteobacteria bacterium]|nr:ACT domain-containing protein [Betaproteobacteria bacterium]